MTNIKPRLGTPTRPAVSRITLLSVVWGDEYIDQMLHITWRSLLSPENCPAISARIECAYLVFTTAEGQARIKNSTQYLLLSQRISVEFRTFDVDQISTDDSYSIHWRMWRAGVAEATERNSAVILIIPDTLYANGTLDRWVGYLESGKRSVFSVGIWCAAETFIPEVMEQYPPEEHDFLNFSRRDVQNSIFRHMHPLIAAAFPSSGRSVYHLERLSEIVPNQGFTTRMTSSQPFAFDPQHGRRGLSWCPENRFDEVAYDEVSFASSGPLLHNAGFYVQPIPLDEDRITRSGGWALGNLHPIGLGESRVDYLSTFSEAPSDEKAWSQTSQSLDKMRDGLHATFAINQICELAESHDCHISARLIAFSALKARLKDLVKVDTTFTVFIPTDAAFKFWEKADYDYVMSGTNPTIVQVLLNHILPERIFLRKGDGIALGPNESNTISKTIADEELVFDKASDTSIISGRIRVGFGTAYLVNNLLFDGRRP